MCHNVHATTVKAFRELLLLLQTKGDIWGVITATSVTCFLHRNTLKGKGAEGEKKGKEKKKTTQKTQNTLLLTGKIATWQKAVYYNCVEKDTFGVKK